MRSVIACNDTASLRRSCIGDHDSSREIFIATDILSGIIPPLPPQAMFDRISAGSSPRLEGLIARSLFANPQKNSAISKGEIV